METKNVPLVIDPCVKAGDIAKMLEERDLNQAVVVLPDKVRRLTHLLERSDTQVMTLVDFPLGNGMTAKKAFEMGKAFEDNAAGVLVCLTPRLFFNKDFDQLKQSLDIYQALGFGRGEVSFMLNLSYLKESEKLDFSDWLKKQSYRNLTFMFDRGYELENDLAIFRFALGDAVELNLLNQWDTPIDAVLLEKYGIHTVFNRLEKLPVIEK